MKKKTGILIVALTAMAGLALANVVAVNSGAASLVGWNTAIWGDPAAVPTVGNDYVHNRAGIAFRGLGAHGAFAGDSLTLQGSGAQVWLQGGGALGGTLILNGGLLQNRGGNVAINGNIQILSASAVLNINGDFDLQTGLSGSGNLNIGNHVISGLKIAIEGADNGYSGSFVLANAGADNVGCPVVFGHSYTNAGLSFQGGNVLRAPTYQLTNDISFLTVSMPSAANTSVLVDLAPGTYDAAALAATGIHSAYYNDLGGTITVILEPAVLGLMGM